MAAPSFRTVRWVRTFNLFAQAVLFLTLFAGLNFLALRHGWRFDLTQSSRHTLSPETRAYLERLREPVRIVVTLTEDSDNEEVTQAYRDVAGLLREFVFADAALPRPQLQVEYLDVLQRRREATALALETPNVILVTSGKNRRIITLDELYKVENRVRQAFSGERALTAAILNVTQPEQKKIYFLLGHKEMSIGDVSPERGLSALAAELTARNFAVDSLILAQTRKIPADAALVVLAGPQEPCEPAEQDLLRQYLSTRAGRLIALLPPQYYHGLDDLLYDDWGILADDDVVMDEGGQGRSDTGDLLLPAVADHPVTASLASYQIALRFGPTRSIRPAPGRTLDANLVVSPLIATSPTAWGERNYRAAGPARFDAGVDLAATPERLFVAAASQRVTARAGLPFSVPGGRLVVFGSADWIGNTRLASTGHLALFLSAVNWTTERDIDLKIPPRPVQRFQLALSETRLLQLRYSLLLGLPGAVALLGLAVYWSRRH